MKTKTLKLTAILLIIAGIFTACNGNEPKPEEPCPCEDKEVFTLPFFVIDVIREECGHLLFEDRGGLGLMHNSFRWTKNLPKEYQIRYLSVAVTYCIMKDWSAVTDCFFPVVHIIEIQKR